MLPAECDWERYDIFFARSACFMLAIFTPSMVMLPSDGVNSPQHICKRVLFPQPFFPIIEVILPLSKAASML